MSTSVGEHVFSVRSAALGVALPTAVGEHVCEWTIGLAEMASWLVGWLVGREMYRCKELWDGKLGMASCSFVVA